MFPIRDHNPSGRTPFVTWGLIILNVAVFAFSWLAYQNEYDLAVFFWGYGLVPAKIMQGQDAYALVTSMFLHGGWLHLIGNMLFLWIFGDNLEDSMGHLGFIGFYLAGGLAAAALQIAMDPTSEVPMIGASGAVAAVMGGYLLLFPRARVDVLIIILVFFRIFTLPAWTMLLIWFGFELINGLADAGGSGGVAYWAHVGGFAGGLLMTWPVWLRRGARRYWARNDGHPPHPGAVYAPSSVPKVKRRR